MKNIFLVTDINHARMQTLDFACYVAKREGAHLVIFFLANIEEESVKVERKTKRPYAKSFFFNGSLGAKASTQSFESSKKKFTDACKVRGVHATAVVFYTPNPKKIILESRFSDLLIIDPKLSFTFCEKDISSQFLGKLLLNVECPVVLPPVSFEGLNEIIVAYDGSKSCMVAIHQFTKLFPEFSRINIVVLFENQYTSVHAMRAINRIRKFVNVSYLNIEFRDVSDDIHRVLEKYLFDQENAFIVAGTMGRNMLSNYFKANSHTDTKGTINATFFAAY